MGSLRKERLDQRLILAIGGADDLASSRVQIEDDYLARERRENLLEQGYECFQFWKDKQPLGKDEKEVDIWKHQACERGLNADRVQYDKDVLEAHLEKDDSRDREIFRPIKTFEIV